MHVVLIFLYFLNTGEVQQLKNEVQQLKNEIVELRSESKIKDETMKMMASVLAGLLTKSSEPVPVPLLNFIVICSHFYMISFNSFINYSLINYFT